jgi:hypothetical protein
MCNMKRNRTGSSGLRPTHLISQELPMLGPIVGLDLCDTGSRSAGGEAGKRLQAWRSLHIYAKQHALSSGAAFIRHAMLSNDRQKARMELKCRTIGGNSR